MPEYLRCLWTTPIKQQDRSYCSSPRPTKCTTVVVILWVYSNYYGKFIKNLATLLHPLNKLLQQNVKWSWSMDCKIAFNQAKQELASSKVLAHYDIKLPIKLAADASSYGLWSGSFNIAQIEALPVTVDQLGYATRCDVDLSQVWQYVQLGWPDVVPERLKPYPFRRDELTVQGNVLMWGIRVIVPNKLQLHREHPGVVRMKSIARSYVWWPGLDQAIEHVVKACSQCQVVKNTAPVAPLHHGFGLLSHGREST